MPFDCTSGFADALACFDEFRWRIDLQLANQILDDSLALTAWQRSLEAILVAERVQSAQMQSAPTQHRNELGKAHVAKQDSVIRQWRA